MHYAFKRSHRLQSPPAQVKGGREISAADKAALDVWCVANASLALDLRILARTVPMALFGEQVDDAAIRRAREELRQVGVRGSAGAASEQSGLLPFAARGETEAAA